MADETTLAESGSVDTLKETIKSKQDFHKYWMSAIQLATDTEKDWCEDAKKAIGQFRTETEENRGPKFNILFANIQTTCPAIYNSEPAPDVRQRFGEAMPVDVPVTNPNDPQAAEQAKIATQQAEAAAEAKNKDRSNVSQTIERAISVQSDMYDYDDALQCAVKDRELMGRAATRLRVNLVSGPDKTDQATGNAVAGAVVSRHITWEPVIWDDLRLGPAKRWPDMPWVAFQWLYTRDELEGLNEKLAWKVNLDATVEGATKDKGSETPDSFKRARVWEIWDRSKRKVYWIAESYDEGPLKEEDDPYRLRGFFPMPKPLYAIKTTDSMVPICPFVVWQAQQEEMNSLTRRIGALIKVIRWRGIYDGAFEKAVQAMKNLDEGEMAPAPDAARALVQGDIEKAFWLMPIEQAVAVLHQLYESRELCKQVIYELTGVADILRGSTKANETLGAQKLKAEWGSLRLQSAQRDVQIHARDLMRMTADLMADHFPPEELHAMTGIELSPEQYKLLKTDLAREFSIDIETDGTIKADLSKAQENVGGFVQGLASYFEAVGPAVQAGFMTPVEAVGLMRTFARNYKLGRQADNILDDWQKRLEAVAKQPPQPPPVDPQVEIEAKKAEAEAAEKQGRLQLDGQEAMGKHQIEQQRLQQEGQHNAAVLALEAQYKGAELEIKKQELALKERDLAARDAQHLDTMGQERWKVETETHQRGMDREHAGKMQGEKAVNDRRVARMKAKPGGGDEADETEALADETPDNGNALAASIEKLAGSVSDATAANREDTQKMVKAILADNQIVRGPDGKVAGSRKIMMEND